MLAWAEMTAWEVRDGGCILAARRCDMGVKERGIGKDLLVFELNSWVNSGAIF